MAACKWMIPLDITILSLDIQQQKFFKKIAIILLR